MSAGTDVGKKRESNQDAYEIGELPDNGAWAAVCDGMGGHAGGNVASSIAVNTISEYIRDNYRKAMAGTSIKNMLEAAINGANVNIYDNAKMNPELDGMGTTVVIAVCSDNKAVIAHVGDSRCLLVSDGAVTQITKDHSYVQELVDAGFITADEAEHHPQKNIITRALGIGENVFIDFTDVTLKKGDMLLLCSDGLTNHATNDEIINCIESNDICDCAKELIALANDNGGSDNITAVVIAN